MSRHDRMRQVDRVAAASILGISPPAVEELTAAGYLPALRACTGELLFRAGDLESFALRNREGDAELVDLVDLAGRTTRPAGASGEPDAELGAGELAEMLGRRVEPMALRMLRMFASAFPEAAKWDTAEQLRFVATTRDRFAAILDVAAAGTGPTEELFRDLGSVGAAAAGSGGSLPELLVLLRMSRDLVVQNAVEIVDQDSRRGGFALSLLLTRILAAMDRLGDAVAAGYWEALLAS